jgi:neck protein
VTINQFFEYAEVETEQDLWNDLIVETIQAYGRDVKYVPRHLINYDELLGADDSSAFNANYTVEMLLKNNYGYGGDKDFYSKFGAQVRDEVVFSVARDRFMAEVGIFEDVDGPAEGDLIWHPMLKKMFVVKFVDPREMFYQLGKVYTWELTCEVFEYSGEDFETGDAAIDNITPRSTNIIDWALTTENGEVLTDENGNVLVTDQYQLEQIDPGSENEYLPQELKKTTDFDVAIQDPFGFLAGQ